jgi:hypothetical protein
MYGSGSVWNDLGVFGMIPDIYGWYLKILKY